MKNRKILLTALVMSTAICSYAQDERSLYQDAPRWYIGVNGGYRATFPTFSEIDKDLFPKTTNLNSGVGALFVQGEFGAKRQFAIRPEIAYTCRGGGLRNIGSNLIDYETQGVDDIFYKVRSGYLDIRVPLIYNFGSPEWAVRPYVYIAPILGFSTGGKVRLQETTVDHEIAGYELDLNKSNYNAVYFAGAAALGMRYHFPLGSSKGFVGLELMYEYGFTNTYGSKETKGEAVNINPMFPANAMVDGSRKYQGLEVKLTFGVPFDAFRKGKNPCPQAPVYVEPEVEEEVEEVVVVDKPCYSLDEIVNMMARGESVEGKTICAIDDDILFDFGQAHIKPASYGYLDRLAETLIRTNSHIVVKGHTDNVGSAESNLVLSKNRAENVANYLRRRGVPASKLSTEYYGMTRPIATNDTEAGRAMNRRVEFEIKK